MALEGHITCIGCPLGCRVTLKATPDNEIESLTGNQCKEGKDYAIAEFQNPVRVLTTTVLSDESTWRVVPVKIDRPVAKNQLKELMRAVAGVKVKPPVKVGQVIVHDILGTGANLVVTRSLCP